MSSIKNEILVKEMSLEELRFEVEEWRSCARYTPLMEGPIFKGWDRSQMERCRKKFLEKDK